MKRVFSILAVVILPGCVSAPVTLNVGGTVNNITVVKTAAGDMTSGPLEADETNTNNGKLDAKVTP